MTVIGNQNGLFFNRESKSGNWEITYDSKYDNVLIEYYSGEIANRVFFLICNKRDFLELQRFIKKIRLKKNYRKI
jgi:hypothetical protein